MNKFIQLDIQLNVHKPTKKSIVLIRAQHEVSILNVDCFDDLPVIINIFRLYKFNFNLVKLYHYICYLFYIF